MAMSQTGPVERTRRSSRVKSGASSISATATYAASYAVRLSRSSQTRPATAPNGTRSTASRSRSARASAPAVSSTAERATVLRTTFATSKGSRCGANSAPEARVEAQASPCGPPSSKAATTTEASTTIVTGDRRRGQRGSSRDRPAARTHASVGRPRPSTRPRQACWPGVPTHREGTPATSGPGEPPGPPAHREHRRARDES